MSESLVELEPSVQQEVLSLGHSVLDANGIEGGRPIITGNYVSPNHRLPLPYPDGDWYLRQTFVPAVHEGETVICHSLLPGLLDHYTKIGLIPEGAQVIQVEPRTDGSSYGFPGTDPLEILKGDLRMSHRDAKAYLCSTFICDQVSQQALEMGLDTFPRPDSTLTNNKASLRQASDRYNLSMLPGTVLQNWEDIEAAVSAEWNTTHGAWLKFPTGSGGDLVIRLSDKVKHEDITQAVERLRATVGKAFAEAEFGTTIDEFWPEGTLAPTGFPLVLEADARIRGEVVANGSTQFIAKKTGELVILGHFTQMTTAEGEYLGNEPYEDIDAFTQLHAERLAARVADYNLDENEYAGIEAIDWFITEDHAGEQDISLVELNSRPTANTPPLIIANKLGAKHFINTNVYTDTPVRSVDDYIEIVGEELAFGDPNNGGQIVPQSFRTLVRREGLVASPNFKIVILGDTAKHCREIMQTLSERGVRFAPE